MWIWGDTVQSLMASDSRHRWDVAKDTMRRPEAPVTLRGEALGGALAGSPPPARSVASSTGAPGSRPRPRARRRWWLGLCSQRARSVPARSSAPRLVLHADSSEMSAWVVAGFAKGFPSL